MSDLISREAICNECMIEKGGKGCWACLVNVAPTVDAVEVVHARWVKSKDGYHICSACNSRGSAIKARYCHHCGAKMSEVM